MRNRSLRWIGLVTVLATCASGTLAACGGGDDDDRPPAGGGNDAGDAGRPGDAQAADVVNDASTRDTSAPDAPSGSDGGGSDATDGGGSTGDASDASPDAPILGGDGGDGGSPVHAHIALLHASPDLGPIRFCIAQGQADDGSDLAMTALPALPHEGASGLLPETFVVMPDITDLSGLALTFFAVNASAIADQTAEAGANEKTCVDYLGLDGKGGSVAAKDVYRTPTLPKGTFANGKTYLASLVGCAPSSQDSNASAQRCGAGYTSAGNVALTVAEIDATTTADAGTVAQLAHRSSAYEGLVAGKGVFPAVLQAVDGGDALVTFTSAPVRFGEIAPTPAATIAQDHLVGVAALPLYADGGSGSGAAVRATWAQMGLSAAPSGTPYTYVLVGDPTQTTVTGDAGQQYGYGVHFVAVPSAFTPPVFQ